MIDKPVDSPTRGNELYSRLNNMPSSWKKRSYVAVASLRSYPSQQFRKLAASFEQLPLQDEVVQKIVEQSVYQHGDIDLSARSDVQFNLSWKTDLFALGGIDEILHLLFKQADGIRDTIRNHKFILPLCQLACYYVQFAPQGMHISRVFVEIATRWAANIRTQIGAMVDPSPKILFSLTAKECLMLGYSILSMSLNEIRSLIDAKQLLIAIVKFRNGLVFSGDTEWECQISHVKVLCSRSVADSIESLYEEVVNHRALLTDALQSVYQRAPPLLDWKCMQNEGSTVYCFEASADSVHYGINIYTGTVLIDGMPPGRLPEDIKCHPAFIRAFGQNDFQVFLVDKSLETLYSYSNAYYDFALISNDLLIRERDASERQMELVYFEHMNLYYKSLPLRLKTMHSHWFCEKEGTVIFRGIKYNEKAISYFVADYNDSGRYCYEVPVSYKHKSWTDLYGRRMEFDRMISNDSSDVAKKLQKFEMSEFVHTLYTASGKIMYSLPRFDLTFLLDDGKLHAQQYECFVLSHNQQYSTILPHFTH
jgi:hypothetical protein